jgi:ABC-type lipoprotein release transport system permease subunit
MTLARLVFKEIGYRKLSLALAALSVVVAVGGFVAIVTILRAHDLRTQQTMDKLEDDMRKEMKRLGFNILILPAGQELDEYLAKDYALKTMPERYVKQLSSSDIITIQHLLPSLRQKVEWKEQGNQDIILVGVRGEIPILHRNPREPILDPVPKGTMVVGYHLYQKLGLSVGRRVTLRGAEFTVSKFHEQRGDKDDITVWINLDEAQRLLGKEGEINEILALKCQCAGVGIGGIQAELSRILPETQIVEVATKALAREGARDRAAQAAKATRQSLEQFAAWLVPLVTLASTVWIGFLAFGNVRERLPEIGILRALGLRSQDVFVLFLGRAVLVGVLGAVVGVLCGLVVGVLCSGAPGELARAGRAFDARLLAAALVAAPLLSAVASWLPAMMAARQDPAAILREG